MDSKQCREDLRRRLTVHLDRYEHNPRTQLAVDRKQALAVLGADAPESLQAVRFALASNNQATHCLLSISQIEQLLNHEPAAKQDGVKPADVPGRRQKNVVSQADVRSSGADSGGNAS